jgi:hypothetical protein
MCCGMLGLVFIGFFAVPEFVEQLYGPSTLRRAGIFYGGTGHLLACQVGGKAGRALAGRALLVDNLPAQSRLLVGPSAAASTASCRCAVSGPMAQPAANSSTSSPGVHALLTMRAETGAAELTALPPCLLQILELICILSWVVATMAAYFLTMHKFNLLRVDVEVELAGLDASKYGLLTTNDLEGAMAKAGGGSKEGSRSGGYGASNRGRKKQMDAQSTAVVMSGAL